jgi:four helix bundle protein
VNELHRKHRDLRVWQEAVAFSALVYEETIAFPKAEQFGLTSQLRRAAVSVAANIAEGAARKSTKELLYFVVVARASAAELDTLIEIAERTGLLKNASTLRVPLDHLAILILRFEAALRKKATS